MNELQQVQLDILKTVTQICDRLAIRYYLVCGSALGAVKYRGFIPWDDDVDVGMFREDYDRFLLEAPACLPEHLFLQTYETDPRYPQIFAKVRNSKTAFIEKSVAGLDMNHGVFVDIFPLDGYPREKRKQKSLERKKKLLNLLLSCVYTGPCSWKIRILRTGLRMLGVHKRSPKILAYYERVISGYPAADSELICNHGNWQRQLEYAPRAQYGTGVMAEFEGLPVRIPAQFDAYLTQKYGDWRADLPKDAQMGHHYCTVCDVHKSYLEYI